MKYLITGSKGQVGSSVKEIVDEAVGLDRSDSDIEQDISDREVIAKIEEEDPEVIVHCAAITDLDYAEENPEVAESANVKGTHNIVKAAESADAHLIYISTDYVFDGETGSYREDDNPDPVSQYARTKYQGEEEVRDSNTRSTILRTSVVFREDLENFFTWAKGELEDGKEVPAITDQTCCPTYAPNLAEIIVEAAEEGITGTYHAAGGSKVTRYESVQIMKEELGLGGKVKRSKMGDLPWEAHRPKDSSLSLAKLKEDFETQPISISEAFRRMKE
ncbi:MAG: NAD(P)-dependent oxidoreductase [Candidatus Nanohaloarchaea archaeon]